MWRVKCANAIVCDVGYNMANIIIKPTLRKNEIDFGQHEIRQKSTT